MASSKTKLTWNEFSRASKWAWSKDGWKLSDYEHIAYIFLLRAGYYGRIDKMKCISDAYSEYKKSNYYR